MLPSGLRSPTVACLASSLACAIVHSLLREFVARYPSLLLVPPHHDSLPDPALGVHQVRLRPSGRHQQFLQVTPVWGSLAHVRTPSVNKLSLCTRACIFLGFPLDASGWLFYDPVTCGFFASQDAMFDEFVCYYRSRPHRGTEIFSPPLFLTFEPPPLALVAPPPSRPAPSGVLHVTPPSSPRQRPVPIVSGGAGGAVAEGEGTRAVGTVGVGPWGARGVGLEVAPMEDTASLSWRPHPASPHGFPSVPQFPPRSSLQPVATEPGGVPAGGTTGSGGVGGGGVGSGGAGAGGTGTVAPTPRTVRFLTCEQCLLGLEEERVRPFPRPSGLVVLRSVVLCLQSPSSLAVLHDPCSDYLCASRPVVSRVLSVLVTHPTAPLSSILALVTTVASFASSHCLDYAAHLIAAEEADMASYRLTGAYVNAVPPSGTNVVSGPRLDKVKPPPESPLVSRYVARGFRQREGVEFFQTFAPAPKMSTLRVLLHIVAHCDYKLHSLDVSIAFLQGSLHEHIWLRCPAGFPGSFPPGTQWQLRRPVYGLRLAPCEWHDTLRSTLAALDFFPSSADPSLFVRRGSTPFFVLVYVQLTPLAVDHGLTAPPSDESFDSSGPYPELVGCLMYLMICTCPDLAYPLSILTLFVASGRHQPSHWHAAKRVAKYVASTSGMGLVLGGKQPVTLTCVVSWRLTQASSVSGSSCEEEVYVAALAAQDLRRLSFLLNDLGEQPCSPPVLFADNKSANLWYEEPRLQRGQALVRRVVYESNTADIFTKVLPPCDHQRFCTQLGLVPARPHLLTPTLRFVLFLWIGLALDDVLTGAEWKKIHVNEALYFKVGDDRVACWVYVDDQLAATSSTAMLKELKELLEAAFELRKISPIEKYLGLEIVHDRPARKLWLHQQVYVDMLHHHFTDEEQTA
ncbi:unnamed protein product [Closterium sp. NIES-53]